jgi:hypothetical protein
MSNNETLIRFHEMNYEERLHITLNRDHFQNAEQTPLAQQVSQAVAEATQSAQQALCRFGALQRTPLCPVPSM